MMVRPAASSSSRTSVAMASISGTTKSGFSASISWRKAGPSSMLITWDRWAICMAGALG
jgi:hypothetical protein